MTDGLTADGCDVEAIDSVFHAISAFTRSPSDLVVLGLADLADRDLEIIRVLREIRPDVYVILVLRSSQRERAVTALSYGADGYILEPFYLEEFLAVARRAFLRLRAGEAAEADFQPPDKDLGRLAGAVAHAVNNPLQILELLMAEEDDDSPEQSEFQQQTERIKTVVEELLNYARRNRIRPVAVDLKKLLKDTVPASRKKDHRVVHDIEPDLPSLEADPRLLELMFRTLAGLPSAKGGNNRLEIVARHIPGDRGGSVLMSFRVPDLILSPDEAGSLFRPFSGPLAGSVGLAAVTARAAIELHGGDVEVTSLEAKGTEVSLTLPVAGPPDEEGSPTGGASGA